MTKVVVVQHAPELKRAELERLRERVLRFLATLQEAAEDVAPPAPGAHTPPVDLCESGEAVTARVELPGVDASSVEVALSSTHLRISAAKKKSAPRGRAAHLCSEREYGRLVRVVPLRWPVSARGATAELRQGLLTVRLPKLKDRRGAEYKIKVTGDG